MALAALLLGVAPAQPARAAVAYFPTTPPPTQVAREMTLQQASRAGIVKLQAKGGGEGDSVSMQLDGKKVKGTIVVTVRAEMTVWAHKTQPEREAIRDLVPYLREKTEAELNRRKYKTSKGEPVRFLLDWQYREPEEVARSNYHQVKMIDPNLDLIKPHPNYRSRVHGRGVPNSSVATTATFSTSAEIPVLAHETMHLAGLDDRYTDFYEVGGKKYPLPKAGMKPSEVEKFAKTHQPPLKTNGKVTSGDIPETDRCDMMGAHASAACRKLSKRDLDWYESQAGVLVKAKPGELLLNKSASKQNFGVAYESSVFAPLGSTTVANGIAVYCIDHDRFFPLDEGFDVGPSAAELPGYEGVAKLLSLNAQVQPNLTESVLGMQAAIWNLTDGTPLETSGTADESRALMAQAGVAENSVPGGLPALEDPNAGTETTGAVDAAGALLPPIAATEAEPPPLVRVYAAQLYPKRLRAGRNLHADLLLGTGGPVENLALRVQRKAGKRWKTIRKLGTRKLATGTTSVPVGFGTLRTGSYRLLIAASGSLGDPAVQRLPFKVQ